MERLARGESERKVKKLVTNIGNKGVDREKSQEKDSPGLQVKRKSQPCDGLENSPVPQLANGDKLRPGGQGQSAEISADVFFTRRVGKPLYCSHPPVDVRPPDEILKKWVFPGDREPRYYSCLWKNAPRCNGSDERAKKIFLVHAEQMEEDCPDLIQTFERGRERQAIASARVQPCKQTPEGFGSIEVYRTPEEESVQDFELTPDEEEPTSDDESGRNEACFTGTLGLDTTGSLEAKFRRVLKLGSPDSDLDEESKLRCPLVRKLDLDFQLESPLTPEIPMDVSFPSTPDPGNSFSSVGLKESMDNSPGVGRNQGDFIPEQVTAGSLVSIQDGHKKREAGSITTGPGEAKRPKIQAPEATSEMDDASEIMEAAGSNCSIA